MSYDLSPLEVQFRADLSGLRAGMEDMKSVVEKAMKQTQQTADQFDIGKLIGKQMTGAMAAIGGTVATAAVVRLFTDVSSKMTDFEARLKRVTESTDSGTKLVMDRLYDMAQRTYSSVDTTTESFLGMSGSLKELGYTTRQQLDFVESLNNALVVSGAKQERAAQVQNALTKAMALGKLSGENLNTVISVGGRVAELLAERLGVGVNQLREMGAQGKITGDIIYDALAGSLTKTTKEAAEMPATIHDGMLRIGNSVEHAIHRMDALSATSGGVSGAFVQVSDAIDIVSADLGLLVGQFDRAGESADDLTLSTEDLAYAMKSVVAGIILAKNGLDQLGNAFLFTVRSAGTIAAAIVDIFGEAGEAQERLFKAMLNPFDDNTIADAVGTTMSNIDGIVERTMSGMSDHASEFSRSYQEDVQDASKAFGFLLEHAKNVEDAEADLDKKRKRRGTSESNDKSVDGKFESLMKSIRAETSALIAEQVMLENFDEKATAAQKKYDAFLAAVQAGDLKLSSSQMTQAVIQWDKLLNADALVDETRKTKKALDDAKKIDVFIDNLKAKFGDENARAIEGMKIMPEIDRKTLDDLRGVDKEVRKVREELEKLQNIPREEIDKRLAKLTALADGQRAAIESLAEARKKLDDSWAHGADKALSDYLEGVRNVAASTEQLMSKAFGGMEDALVEFVTKGKLSFSSLADSVIADITRMVVRAQITGPLANMVMGTGGSSNFLSYLIGSVGNLISGTQAPAPVSSAVFTPIPGRASGGPVSAGRLYQVNERRPELLSYGGRDYLMMGGKDGYVKPTADQAAAPASRPIHVVMNINVPGTVDRRTASQVAAEAGRAVRLALARNG